jgi:hypothetical protein
MIGHRVGRRIGRTGPPGTPPRRAGQGFRRPLAVRTVGNQPVKREKSGAGVFLRSRNAGATRARMPGNRLRGGPRRYH